MGWSWTPGMTHHQFITTLLLLTTMCMRPLHRVLGSSSNYLKLWEYHGVKTHPREGQTVMVRMRAIDSNKISIPIPDPLS